MTNFSEIILSSARKHCEMFSGGEGFWKPKAEVRKIYDADKFAGYSLKFLSGETPLKVALSDDGYVLNERTPYPLDNCTLPLGGYPFEDSLAFTAMPKAATLLDEAGKTILSMEYADFDNLVLWRMANAPFFCIEPWCSLPSRKGIVEELSTQPGLVALEEGDFKATFKIRFGE